MYSYLNRIRLSPLGLILVAAIFLVLTGNVTFFNKLSAVYPWGVARNAAFAVSVGVLLASLLVLLMTMLSSVLSARITVCLFIVLASIVGYFADHFGVVIDTEMVRNVLETDSSETADLLNAGLFLRVALLGILPSIVILRMPLRKVPLSRKIGHGALSAVGSTCLIGLCLFVFGSQYANFVREHKPLRYYANPVYALYSVSSFATDAIVVSPQKSTELAITVSDAQIDDDHTGRELIIMVVGETARRDRFSLNGYPRDTNPLLRAETNIVSYTNVSACGTSTAVSVPCMFAMEGHEKFNRGDNNENLLDVLSRAGVTVLWRDNNSGSKGVAARVPYEDFSTPDLNSACDVECRDVGMLHGLQEFIDEQGGDVLIVLHQMGNHGPAYFKRYPPEFERFTPACHSSELSACTDEEIGNAYDNAILYTDYFLSQIIALLKANTPEFETAMLFVSDHGESLGEKGLYLHGAPYVFAPVEQTAVPVIVWIGESSDIELTSALEMKDRPTSHDAIFNSMLSAFEIDSAPFSAPRPLFRLAAGDE